jgi:hypothetical protein
VVRYGQLTFTVNSSETRPLFCGFCSLRFLCVLSDASYPSAPFPVATTNRHQKVESSITFTIAVRSIRRVDVKCNHDT